MCRRLASCSRACCGKVPSISARPEPSAMREGRWVHDVADPAACAAVHTPRRQRRAGRTPGWPGPASAPSRALAQTAALSASSAGPRPHPASGERVVHALHAVDKGVVQLRVWLQPRAGLRPVAAMTRGSLRSAATPVRVAPAIEGLLVAAEQQVVVGAADHLVRPRLPRPLPHEPAPLSCACPCMHARPLVHAPQLRLQRADGGHHLRHGVRAPGRNCNASLLLVRRGGTKQNRHALPPV